MSSVPLAIKTEEVILENAEYNSAEELDEELQLQLEDSGGESAYIEYTTEPHHSQTITTTTTQRNQRHQNSNMNNSSNPNTPGGVCTKSNSSTGGGGTNGGSGSNVSGNGGNKIMLESEKRMRREIANCNERRRMQSINAGFQNLRSLLPRHEGEKLSKAAILQQTSQYIMELENQKTQLLAQNSELKRQVGEHEVGGGGGEAVAGVAVNDPISSGNAAVAIKKRKLTDNVINIQAISDSSDEGLGSMSPEPMTLLNAAVGSSNAAAAAAITKLNNATLVAQTVTKEMAEVKKQLDKERSLRRLLEDELQMIKRQLYSVATAPPGTAAVAAGGVTTTYIPHEVIEHTENYVRDELDDLGTVSYVEIDEMTGQQKVVVCSSIEELEADAAAEIITEDHVHEEVILSSNSSTESENEVNVNAIAKAYAEGNTPSAAVLQPILQAAIKATPKVEVERLNDKIMKVKTEKIEQPSGGATFTRSRQNLETIVEAIRHLEGDHLFADGGGSGGDQYKLQQVVHHQHQVQRIAQDAPLALTNKQQQQQAQRTTLAELRPFLQLKGNKQVTILTTKSSKDVTVGNTTVTPTAIFKVHSGTGTVGSTVVPSGNVVVSSGSMASSGGNVGGNVTITTSLKQCRPGVIVAKQLSSS